MQLDLKAIRVQADTKATIDIRGKGAEKVVDHRSYRALVNDFFTDPKPIEKRNRIAILARPNRLLIIDVDAGGAQHKYDGREWWNQFSEENHIQQTYTVRTKNGGLHLYFRIPASMDEDQFQPPGKLANGVDVIWNTYVLAPPSPGYNIVAGSIFEIAQVPATLMMAMENAKNGSSVQFSGPGSGLQKIHQPFSPEQINDLKLRIKWFQQHGTLGYQEWRDGLFSLKAGAHHNPDLLAELVNDFTNNQSYQPGDEQKAWSIIENASEFGNIGPGTIFNILKDCQVRSASAIYATPYTKFEVLNRAGIRYTTGASGEPKVEPSESNTSAILDIMFPKENLFLDIRSQQYVFNGKPMAEAELINKMLPVIQSDKGMGLSKFKKNYITNGLDLLMYERQIDPHIEMLNNTVWDGRPRVDRFFAHYFRCPDNEYHKMASKNFWISMAARGLNPGAKVDFMVVIEGKEGINKSSLVRLLGGDYTFAPVRDDLMSNENELRKMHQATVVELPELVGLMGKDPRVVKGFLTSMVDSIRPLYGKKAYDHPRGFVFVGTTNDRRYLTFDFGERRFLPIEIWENKQVDSVGVRADREQLFAEAVHRYKQGEPWWIIPEELLAPVIAKKRIVDPVAESIIPIVAGRSYISIVQIYKELMVQDLVPKGFSQNTHTRIVNILRAKGFEETETKQGAMWKNPNPNSGSMFEDYQGASDLI